MFLPRVVKVAVDQASYHFDKLYSYVVPEPLEPLSRGCRVIVPFGGGNRKRLAVVMECDAKAEVQKLKPVLEVVDKTPLLTDEMLDLAQWLKQRTFCTVYDGVRAMLPTGFSYRLTPCYVPAEDPPPEDALNLEEKRLLAALADFPDGLEGPKLLALLGLESDDPLPLRLTEKGFLTRIDVAARTAGDATMRMVRLTEPGADQDQLAVQMACTQKQKAVLHLLAEVGEASVKEVAYLCGVTEAVVQALIKKGLAEIYEREVLRRPYKTGDALPPIRSVPLNGEQQQVFDGLAALVDKNEPAGALLFGVTGSGKTQVYMNLIDRVLTAGKQALVMVPEISLTPQMLELFLARYGGRVAMLHSGMSMGERMDEFKRIRRGEATVVIGTRSAVFAPLTDIGLIVMDEEQEHTYKSESAPRYHARDVARFRCAAHKALLLMCSATPSVETYHAAKTGRYSLFELKNRYGDAGLPRVEIADLRGEPMTGAVGERLRGAIGECLGAGKQAILLLNRRGYHTHVSCRACGYVMTCPFCSVSLTYHRANDQLVCHYCGYIHSPVRVCPACGSDKIRYAGLGTQRVEDELKELFPQASVLRMDADTTQSRFAYEQRFGEFAAGKYDIMVGTQMVAKGLDFPRVGLVGVLSADQSLYGGDYRSFETTFSLITQVIGRAGRRTDTGLAVVQTYSPDNYVIRLAARQDYPGFYETEIAARRQMRYPPYTDLCLFLFSGVQENVVKAATSRFLEMLRGAVTGKYAGLPVIVLDPGPAILARLSGKYRFKVLMKAGNTKVLRDMLGELITAFARDPLNKTVTLTVDINPVSMP